MLVSCNFAIAEVYVVDNISSNDSKACYSQALREVGRFFGNMQDYMRRRARLMGSSSANEMQAQNISKL